MSTLNEIKILQFNGSAWVEKTLPAAANSVLATDDAGVVVAKKQGTAAGNLATVGSNGKLPPSIVSSQNIVRGGAGPRQCILGGNVDPWGRSNFILKGTGLTALLKAGTENPYFQGIFRGDQVNHASSFIVSFAYGFDEFGSRDSIVEITAQQSWAGLASSKTNYLYIDRHRITGAITTGHTTLAPLYQSGFPKNTIGQHTFDVDSFSMWETKDPVDWQPFQRVFVGEAVTNATSVTSIKSYAIRGMFQGVFPIKAGTDLTINHNLGVPAQYIDSRVIIEGDNITPSEPYGYSEKKNKHTGVRGLSYPDNNTAVLNLKESKDILTANSYENKVTNPKARIILLRNF